LLYSVTQAELANMTRVMTMGALTASIAHEVNQPLSGMITYAGSCLRMLAADPPNIEGALETHAARFATATVRLR
jgi:C4-dicarboxylate-specific signal transduction histidine kinase